MGLKMEPNELANKCKELEEKVMIILRHHNPAIALMVVHNIMVAGYHTFKIDKKVMLDSIADTYDNMLITRMKMNDS